MDYEQMYKEALERAREIYHRGYYVSGDIEHIFPELKESDDERIKKDLIGFFKDGEFLYHKKEEIVEWLEKQGEKKPKFVAKKEATGVLKEMLDNIDPVELEETRKEMMEESASTDDTFFDDYRKTDGEYDEVHISEHDHKSVHLQFTAEGRNISDFCVSKENALMLAETISGLYTPTDEEVQKLHDHLEMHRELGGFKKPIEVNVDELPDNPVDAFAKGVEKARSEMRSEP